MARILIVGGGCRGRLLAGELVSAGHAARVTTRSEVRRERIESVGAECWVGTPDRLATLRGVLDGVAIACWMLARARGPAEQVAALHASRLEFFLHQVIDTTVRGFLYDASPGLVPPEALAKGARIARSLTELNAIPARVVECARGDGGDRERAEWIAAARGAIESLLGGRRERERRAPPGASGRPGDSSGGLCA